MFKRLARATPPLHFEFCDSNSKEILQTPTTRSPSTDLRGRGSAASTTVPLRRWRRFLALSRKNSGLRRTPVPVLECTASMSLLCKVFPTFFSLLFSGCVTLSKFTG